MTTHRSALASRQPTASSSRRRCTCEPIDRAMLRARCRRARGCCRRCCLGHRLGGLRASRCSPPPPGSSPRAAEQPPVLYLSLGIVGVRAFALGRAVFRYLERLAGPRCLVPPARDHPLGRVRAAAAVAPDGLAAVARGDLLARFVGDVDELQNVSLRIVQPVVSAVVVLIAAIAGVAWIAPASAWAVTRVPRRGDRRGHPRAARSSPRARSDRLAPLRGELQAAVVEHVQALDVLVAFDAADAGRRGSDASARGSTRHARAAAATGAASAAMTAVGGFAVAASLAAPRAAARRRRPHRRADLRRAVPRAARHRRGRRGDPAGDERLRLAARAPSASPSAVPDRRAGGASGASGEPVGPAARPAATPAIRLRGVRARWLAASGGEAPGQRRRSSRRRGLRHDTRPGVDLDLAIAGRAPARARGRRVPGRRRSRTCSCGSSITRVLPARRRRGTRPRSIGRAPDRRARRAAPVAVRRGRAAEPAVRARHRDRRGPDRRARPRRACGNGSTSAAGSTRRSASAAASSRAGRRSASPSPGRCSPTSRCSCSTSRRRASIPARADALLRDLTDAAAQSGRSVVLISHTGSAGRTHRPDVSLDAGQLWTPRESLAADRRLPETISGTRRLGAQGLRVRERTLHSLACGAGRRQRRRSRRVPRTHPSTKEPL